MSTPRTDVDEWVLASAAEVARNVTRHGVPITWSEAAERLRRTVELLSGPVFVVDDGGTFTPLPQQEVPRWQETGFAESVACAAVHYAGQPYYPENPQSSRVELTSHVVVTGSTTRENLYVAMTRGRESNIAYVARDRPDDIHATPSPDEVTAKTILYGVLQHSGVELSAHQTIEAEQDHWSSFAQLAAEYLTIAAEAQRDRWIAELRAAGLPDEQVDAITASDSFGPLASELRRAEANAHDITEVLPRIVAQRSLDDADDIGAVLISRLRHATFGSRRIKRRGGRLIAGLVPVADGPMADDMHQALAERQDLMEARASALGEAAVAQRAPWVKRLGEPPADPQAREEWMLQVRVVAAYRDRYGVECSAPVGADVRTDIQGLDAARARKAARHAASISTNATHGTAPPVLEGQALG